MLSETLILIRNLTRSNSYRSTNGYQGSPVLTLKVIKYTINNLYKR